MADRGQEYFLFLHFKGTEPKEGVASARYIPEIIEVCAILQHKDKPANVPRHPAFDRCLNLCNHARRKQIDSTLTSNPRNEMQCCRPTA